MENAEKVAWFVLNRDVYFVIIEKIIIKPISLNVENNL